MGRCRGFRVASGRVKERRDAVLKVCRALSTFVIYAELLSYVALVYQVVFSSIHPIILSVFGWLSA